MKNNIKSIKLFPNYNEKSQRVALKLEKLLTKYGFSVVQENYDLGIAIGGDGSFLRMVKGTNFNLLGFNSPRLAS